MQLPVAITVEGANILTRSLIIFGQGAIRCHPFVLKEIARRATKPTAARASIAFDARCSATSASSLSNMARTFVMGLTRLALRARAGRRRARNAALLSAADALLGGVRLSRRRLDGRAGRRAEAQGEVLRRGWATCCRCSISCSATLKRYEDEGRQAADAPLMHWAIWDALFKAQNAHRGRDLEFPRTG